MSDLRVSVCCGALVSPIQGDPCCCWCERENVMTETIAQRDHRMRVEGAMAALDSDWSEFPAADMSITSEAERLVAEHEKEGKHGSA